MNTIAKLKEIDRKFIFSKTSESMGKNIAIIEKDYWICYFLDFLFNKSKFKNILIFKGGTSLSKGYNLIDRMSEDIDLVLDWKILNLTFDLKKVEVDKNISKSQLDKRKKEILEKTNFFIKEIFTPYLAKEVKQDLGYKVNIKCYKENGCEVVYIEYPRTMKDDYLLDTIKLEIGPIASSTPIEEIFFKPYCFDYFPEQFITKETKVKAISPERSFWEKATILYRECCRPANKSIPIRYSRHYYDLYKLSKSKYKSMAFKNMNLLLDVINFKQKFYRESWMNYRDIYLNGIRLIPDDFRLSELKRDFMKMRDMISDNVSLEEIFRNLKILEKEINTLLIKKGDKNE